MTEDAITVLADNVLCFYSPRRVIVLINRLLGKDTKPKYGGHFSVTRSLVEGLYEINAEFNYNPKKFCDINKNVIVLSDITILKRAIKLKRKGKINKLFAGPNIAVLPSDYRKFMIAKEIDRIIVHSEWVRDAFEQDIPELFNKCIIWTAGVNPNHYKPLQTDKKNNLILIFQKFIDDEAIKPYKSIILERGYCTAIIKYGNYCSDDYLKTLQSCKAAVFITQTTETQGIALAEAWSVDVPTFVLEVDTWSYKDYPRFPGSSSPYLSSNTGVFFSNIDDFKIKFNLFVDGKLNFSPRKWVLNSMTDSICAERLRNIILDYK